MKLVSTITRTFIAGKRYQIEETVGYPHEYFRKPITLKEDPSRKGTRLKDGDIDDLSDWDICIKSFKIVEKWYE